MFWLAVKLNEQDVLVCSFRVAYIPNIIHMDYTQCFIGTLTILIQSSTIRPQRFQEALPHNTHIDMHTHTHKRKVGLR